MRLALAQYRLSASMDENLAKVLELMQSASQQGAQMIMFPELCLSPFFPQFPGKDASGYLMQADDSKIQRLQAACKSLNLIASPNIYLREGTNRFDASLMIDAQGGIQGISKMVHIAQFPCFYEQDYYFPSDSGFIVYEIAGAKIGIVICFDRHYPESIRTCALRGAQLVIIPTANTIGEPRDLFECELRAAAVQNSVFIAMCNRVGREGDVTFCGESTVIGPRGEVILKAGEDADLMIADIDLTQADAARQISPYLSLRRPELYA